MKTTLLSLLALVLCASGGWLWCRYHDAPTPPESPQEQERRFSLVYQKRFDDLLTDADWEVFSREIEQASGGIKARYEPYILLKKARAEFLQAEEYLFRAISLQNALRSGSEKIGVNPLPEEYLDKSFTLYRLAKEHIDVLTNIPGDEGYNFELNFTRGNIYFRVLQFIAGPNELREIFEQTAVAWEKALEAKEKDIDAQINLEILITNQNALLSGSRQNPGDVLKKLQQPSLGRGGRRGVL